MQTNNELVAKRIRSTKQHTIDLNDVLNFINKANRLQKRAIDLALGKQTHILLAITDIDYNSEAHRQVVLTKNKQSFSLDFLQSFEATGFAPAFIKIERRDDVN